MTNRMQTSDLENIGGHLGRILGFIQDEEKFKLLGVKKPKSESFMRQYLERNLDREVTEEEFTAYYKGYLEDFCNRLDIRDILINYGETRSEVIENMAIAIMRSPELLQTYKDTLREKLGYQVTPDSNNDTGLGNRFKGSQQRKSNPLYERMKLHEMDMKYLNLFGGRN
jgi:hypothetical protein